MKFIQNHVNSTQFSQGSLHSTDRGHDLSLTQFNKVWRIAIAKELLYKICIVIQQELQNVPSYQLIELAVNVVYISNQE